MQETPRSILKKYWGHDDFRGSQKKIIDAVLEKKDVLTLMPTGGGKSICYQIPGLVQDGICIVVSPLVALIQNQVSELKAKGIKAIALTGGISFDELNDLLDNCLYGGYKFLYLSPERLQQSLVQERIKGMNVNLIAIDEAHCISQWGNDFRPAYLECAVLRGSQPNAPLIALTATATSRVANDIITLLSLKEEVTFKDSFERSNIALAVKHTEDKWFQLKTLLSKTHGCAIIYVRSRKMCAQLSTELNNNGFNSTFFHGGILRSEKENRLQQWLTNKIPIMVATNAFGMGVDKPDVRLVVHYQIPDSLESYFQEAGRGGRDGKEAQAKMLTNNEDKLLAQRQFLASLPDAAYLKKLYKQLCNYFQVSYGELPLEPFPLNFNQFCKQYDLNTHKVYQGLKLLGQNSVISLNDAFSQKTTLKFVASKQNVFAYFENHPKQKNLIQTILRTYGGITDYETKVNTLLIANKIGISESSLLENLEQLQVDGILEFKTNKSDLEVLFLMPREDDRTINPFGKKISTLNKTKEHNLQQMLAYVENKKVCRSQFILNYFGEKSSLACGKCDICLNNVIKQGLGVEESILEALKEEPLSSRALLLRLQMDETQLLKSLQSLLEEDIIQLNSENEYVPKAK